jgi:ABC-type transport system substrate-binding protein
MNKKVLYAIIAVVVVIILIVGVLEVMPTSSAASITVSSSSATATVGQSLTFAAFISGGTPSNVIFNFGDGATETATHLSGNEYTVTHSYAVPGKYLVTANASVNGKTVNNLNSIIEVSVTPMTVSASIASELTEPSIIMTTQIYSKGSNISLTGSILQPPTEANWAIGYYIWSFGDGVTHIDYAVMNTSSGNFMPDNVSHIYSNAGIYALTLGIITFNTTNYVPSNYTLDGIVYTYYPLSDLSTILSNGNYYNNTYINTVIVTAPGQTAQLLKTTASATNPHEIVVTEVVPGGPFSFDPATSYDAFSLEILVNVYETLVSYNGSSTSQLFPMIASEIPTIANGGLSPNYLNYTFHIRSGLKFANGDPVTAWDVYTSFIRTLLFVTGVPGTAGWIPAQDLLPGGGFAPNATSYQNITRAITVDNTTQTVTFHLLKPDPAFLDYLADPSGTSITDYSWLVAHGAGITFTPAGFAAYMAYGVEVNYNNYVRYNTMGSGPYIIKSFLIGQSIALAPNPDYTPIPGVPGYSHPANDTIYIQWEKDPSTALLMAESGQTDILVGIPNQDYPVMSHLASEGKVNITSFSTLSVWFYVFNFNINTTMLSSLGPGYSIPKNYFTNLDVRRAFAYAYDYTNYIDNILGNSKYGTTFGTQYVGIIPKGMVGAMNTTQLEQAGAIVPYYNLTIAKQYMEESGVYNESINIPIIVPTADPVDFAAAQDWASTLSAIDPNIHASPSYMEFPSIFGYEVPNENPMPIYFLGWVPDYPFPSDYIGGMYWESGITGLGNGYNPQILANAGHMNQSREDALLNQYIADAESTGNLTLSLQYYDKAESLAVNLTFFVYLYQQNEFWYYSPGLHGVQYEENPIYGGSGDTVYIYLSK